MPDVNRRQAQVPRGAIVLDNPNGTAPGLARSHHGGSSIVLLPGPPRELQPMFDALCAGPLRARAGAERLHGRDLFVDRTRRVARRGDRRSRSTRDGATRTPPIETTILATPGQIELHLTLRDRGCGAGAPARLARARDELAARARRATSSAPTAARWRKSSATCSRARADDRGRGVVHRRAVDVAADRRARQLRVRARRRRRYSNEAKTELLGVSRRADRAHGAVSEPVAVAMADGIRDAHRRRRGGRRSPASPVRAAARRRSRSAPSRSPFWCRTQPALRAHVLVRRRPARW